MTPHPCYPALPLYTQLFTLSNFSLSLELYANLSMERKVWNFICSIFWLEGKVVVKTHLFPFYMCNAFFFVGYDIQVQRSMRYVRCLGTVSCCMICWTNACEFCEWNITTTLEQNYKPYLEQVWKHMINALSCHKLIAYIPSLCETQVFKILKKYKILKRCEVRLIEGVSFWYLE